MATVPCGNWQSSPGTITAAADSDSEIARAGPRLDGARTRARARPAAGRGAGAAAAAGPAVPGRPGTMT